MFEQDVLELLPKHRPKPSFRKALFSRIIAPVIGIFLFATTMLANTAMSAPEASAPDNQDREQPELVVDAEDIPEDSISVKIASQDIVAPLPPKPLKLIEYDFNSVSMLNILPVPQDVFSTYGLVRESFNLNVDSTAVLQNSSNVLSSFPIPLSEDDLPVVGAKKGETELTVIHPCLERTLSKHNCFTNRKHPISGRWKDHLGGDYIAMGKVVAPFDGIVAGAAYYAGYGNRVVLLNPETGLVWMGAHLSRMSVKIGQAIQQGQKIGIAGNTGYSKGTHLHSEMGQIVQSADGGYVIYLFNPMDATGVGNVYPIEGRIDFLDHAFTKSGLKEEKKNEASWGVSNLRLDIRKKINPNNVPVEYKGRLYTPAAYAALNKPQVFSGHPLVDLVIHGETRGTLEQRYNAVAGRKSTDITCDGATTQLTNMTCNEGADWAIRNRKCITSNQFAGSTLKMVIGQAGLSGDEHLTEGVQHLLSRTHIHENCGFQALLEEKNPEKQAELRRAFKVKFAQQYRCMGIYGDTYPDKYSSGNQMKITEYMIDQAIDKAILMYKLRILPDFHMENPNVIGPPDLLGKSLVGFVPH